MNNALIKDLPLMERPRERFLKIGAENISNEELLSILLKTGSKNESVKVLASRILKSINNITDLKDISINKLTNIKGIGEVKAITLLSAIELGRRVYKEKEEKKILINTPKKAFLLFNDDLKNKKQEYFYAIYLDNKKYLIDKKLLFIGTINKSVVHPREIFKYAYILSASSIICVHNHPSGDPLPSKEDINFTNTIMKIGNIQGINVIDHVIVGNNNYYSIYENDIGSE